MAQERSNKTASRDYDETDIADLPTEPLETDSDVDDLLDEIDNVLEENAESFVKEYVQKGGE